jgi:hypothetical protein
VGKLRTAIIIIGLILGFVIFGTYYRKSHTIVSPEIRRLYADDIDIIAESWLQKNDEKKGVFLRKVFGARKSVKYYLFLNNIQMRGLNIKPDTYNGIRIQVDANENISGKSEVFIIKPTNKQLKYIILNDSKFDVSSILEIN